MKSEKETSPYHELSAQDKRIADTIRDRLRTSPDNAALLLKAYREARSKDVEKHDGLPPMPEIVKQVGFEKGYGTIFEETLIQDRVWADILGVLDKIVDKKEPQE